MSLRITAALATLTLSAPAFADFEAGAHAGYTMMSMSGGGEPFSGPAFGARAGFGVGLGLTPEINVTHYSGTNSDDDESSNLSQLQTGLGARFYIGNFFLRPFASGHLTYATAAKRSFSKGEQETAATDVPGSGGMGVDFGGGLQLKFLDLIYGELQGTYARTMTDAALSNIYVGAGLGIKI